MLCWEARSRSGGPAPLSSDTGPQLSNTPDFGTSGHTTSARVRPTWRRLRTKSAKSKLLCRMILCRIMLGVVHQLARGTSSRRATRSLGRRRSAFGRRASGVSQEWELTTPTLTEVGLEWVVRPQPQVHQSALEARGGSADCGVGSVRVPRSVFDQGSAVVVQVCLEVDQSWTALGTNFWLDRPSLW